MVFKGLLLGLLAVPFVQGDASDYIDNAICNANQLYAWFDPNKGLWPSSNGGVAWWTGANMMTAINNLALLSNDAKNDFGSIWSATYNNAPNNNPNLRKRKRSDGVTEEVYTRHSERRYEKRQSNSGFLDSYYDDEGWWGLAWIGAFDNTQDQDYLNEAIAIWNDINSSYGKAPCGAVPWRKTSGAPSLAIENELYIQLGAAIANRVSSDQKNTYLSAAQTGWQWFIKSGLINSGNLINDGLTSDTCQNDGNPTFSYNQGVILGAAAELYIATNDSSYLDTAADIANAVTTPGSSLLNSNGILVDGCDKADNCSGDGVQFKGVFLRNLQKLYKVRQSDQWKNFITTNAQSIWNNDMQMTSSGCANGVYWAGPYNTADPSSQSSALDALVAALAVTQ